MSVTITITMSKKDIITIFKSKYYRGSIIAHCYKDKVTPFEVILSLLKDYFKDIDATDARHIANTLVKEYKLDYEKRNIKHSNLSKKYEQYRKLWNKTIYPNRYACKCKEYKGKIIEAQREYSEKKRLYDYLYEN